MGTVLEDKIRQKSLLVGRKVEVWQTNGPTDSDYRYYLGLRQSVGMSDIVVNPLFGQLGSSNVMYMALFKVDRSQYTVWSYIHPPKLIKD